MPFAGYSDFADCVSQNGDKDNPQAYCGSIQSEVEGKSDQGHGLADLPADAQKMWAVAFTEALSKNEPSGSAKIAWANVYRHWEKSPSGQWVALKVLSDITFKSILKQDRIIYGAASVAVKDTDNELITEDALRTAFNSYITRGHVLFYHQNIPIGEVLPSFRMTDGTELKSGVHDKQLDIVVRIYKDTQIANDVWKEIETGRLRAFSIGGQVLGESVRVCEDASDPTNCYQRIDRMDLHEVSIVPNPANEASYFQVIKSKVEPVLSKESKKLADLEALISNEKMMAVNCPQFTEKALRILKGDDMAESKVNLVDLQAMKETIVKEVLERIRKQPPEDEKPTGCPEGHQMVDGECVKIEEKSVNMAEEKKTDAQAATDPVKADVDALKAEVKGFSERFDKLETLLAKALKTEASVEKVPDVIATLTDKKSIASDDKKDTSIDWSKPISRPGDLQLNANDFMTKIRSK